MFRLQYQVENDDESFCDKDYVDILFLWSAQMTERTNVQCDVMNKSLTTTSSPQPNHDQLYHVIILIQTNKLNITPHWTGGTTNYLGFWEQK